jgi:hypothetical protein
MRGPRFRLVEGLATSDWVNLRFGNAGDLADFIQKVGSAGLRQHEVR